MIEPVKSLNSAIFNTPQPLNYYHFCIIFLNKLVLYNLLEGQNHKNTELSIFFTLTLKISGGAGAHVALSLKSPLHTHTNTHFLCYTLPYYFIRVGGLSESNISHGRGMNVYISLPTYLVFNEIGYRCCCLINNRTQTNFLLNVSREAHQTNIIFIYLPTMDKREITNVEKNVMQTCYQL